MNKSLERLQKSAQKEERHVIGLMSGTSLDGLDVALCRFKGTGAATEAEVVAFTDFSYPQELVDRLDRLCFRDEVDAEILTVMNAELGKLHGQMVNQALLKWEIGPETIDAIASHGQTVYHAPAHQQQRSAGEVHSTLQIGDGDRIAQVTGIPTLCDFRQKDIAIGGEGAPLAVYGDVVLFSKPQTVRFLLNIGGISNFTFLDGSGEIRNTLTTDTGPGNTMMNSFMRTIDPPQNFDRNGELASSGHPDQMLLNELLSHHFFETPFPKSTGPEVFNLDYLQECREKTDENGLSNADVMATLNLFTARSIAEAVKTVLAERVEADAPNAEVIVSGGGVHNPVLQQNLRSEFPSNVKLLSLAELGINPDAKEALLFAAMANETIAGEGLDNIYSGDPAKKVHLGKIALPD